jgi:hypothetical protein
MEPDQRRRRHRRRQGLAELHGRRRQIGIVDDGIDYNHSRPRSALPVQSAIRRGDGGCSAYAQPVDRQSRHDCRRRPSPRPTTASALFMSFNAGFAGDRIGYGSNGNTSQYADALNHLLTSGFDVANNSWGYATPFRTTSIPIGRPRNRRSSTT